MYALYDVLCCFSMPASLHGEVVCTCVAQPGVLSCPSACQPPVHKPAHALERGPLKKGHLQVGGLAAGQARQGDMHVGRGASPSSFSPAASCSTMMARPLGSGLAQDPGQAASPLCSMAWPLGSGLAHLRDFAVCLGGLPQITSLDLPEMPCLMTVAIGSPVILRHSVIHQSKMVRGYHRRGHDFLGAGLATNGSQARYTVLSKKLWLDLVSYQCHFAEAQSRRLPDVPAAMLIIANTAG